MRGTIKPLTHGFAAGLLAAFLMGLAWQGQADSHAEAIADKAPPGVEDPRGPGVRDDPNKPRRHFRIDNPKELRPEEAEAVYDELRDTMGDGYALSKDPTAAAYRGWRRYNIMPYRSATHGQRYVNNYANAKGAAYGMFENAGRLPEGTVIAKDSFTVTDEGDVSAGPLFVMEKMAEGFNYVSGDWRYTMIMPDGSVFGRTKGENADAVRFCIPCHLAAERHDHLHFMPKDFRAEAN